MKKDILITMLIIALSYLVVSFISEPMEFSPLKWCWYSRFAFLVIAGAANYLYYTLKYDNECSRN